jgi:signal transduction histidine kinase
MVGAQMVAQGKQMRLDAPGLVPLAARTLQATVSNHALQDSDHILNPLLPNTRSELAIPMLYRGKLVGVLDLQSEKEERFNLEDVRILTTLAEQIAIAVTNARLFEEAQAALATAERANQVKSTFLASVSHELRTPLNAILNFAYFLASGMVGTLSDEQVDLVQKLSSSGKHLLNLINDVLDISKIESGSLSLLVEDNIDLAEEIQTVIALGQTLLTDKPVELRTDVAANLPLITGDRRRIRQIMLNLVSNACKFTEEGQITLAVHPREQEILISVKDTGPGIAAQDHELIFESFRQNETGIRQAEGTGLGLPISRSLATAHGGRLWLESVPGKGSIFFVTLPIRSPQLESMVVMSGANGHDA